MIFLLCLVSFLWANDQLPLGTVKTYYEPSLTAKALAQRATYDIKITAVPEQQGWCIEDMSGRLHSVRLF